MKLFRAASHLLAAMFNERAHFDRAWQSYSTETLSAFEGRWAGEWVSSTNGHHGELKCLLTHPQPGAFGANFRATYARFLSVAYLVHLKAEPAGAGYHLKGEADLGILAGGVYSYEGQLSSSAFDCNYQCKYDKGVFRLTRLS